MKCSIIYTDALYNFEADVADCCGISRLTKYLLLIQCFFIIFNYHILKDLKDTVVITCSEAGADAIPFIKLWVILPFSLLASYVFNLLYHRIGHARTFYFFVGFFLCLY